MDGIHEHMTIMIRVLKTIDWDWEQTLMHTTTYHPTPVHRSFHDETLGTNFISLGRFYDDFSNC